MNDHEMNADGDSLIAREGESGPLAYGPHEEAWYKPAEKKVVGNCTTEELLYFLRLRRTAEVAALGVDLRCSAERDYDMRRAKTTSAIRG